MLKRFVGGALMPLPLALVGLSLGSALLWLARWRRVGRWMVTASVIFLLLVANETVSTHLIVPFEKKYAPIAECTRTEDLPLEIRACKVIAVLGSGNGDAPGRAAIDELSSGGLARLVTAVRLARLLPDARVILSGTTPEDRLPHSRVMRDAAVSLGLDPARISLIEGVRDTNDEAKCLWQSIGGQRVALITSAWHMPRAVGLCRKQGLDPIPIPTDFLATPSNSAGSHEWGWSISALERSTCAFHEALGLLWTRLRDER